MASDPNQSSTYRLAQALRHTRDFEPPNFAQGLLTQSWLNYILWRLRFPLFSVFIFVLLNTVEYIYFFRIFSEKYLFVPLISLSAAGLLRAVHWGMLEDLRRKAREKMTSDARFVGSIRLWLCLSAGLWVFWVFMSIALISAARGRYDDLTSGQISIGTAVWIGAGCELLIQTLSAALAEKRFQRPLSYLLLMEAGGSIVAVLLFPFFGAFAVALGVVLAAAVRTGVYLKTLSTEMNRRRQSALTMRSVLRLSRPRLHHLTLAWTDMRLHTVLSGGAAGILDRIGHIVTLGVLLGNPYSILAITFHIMSPAVNAATSWPRVFYFDFSHPRNASWRPMMTSLLKSLRKTSFFLALILSLMAALPVLIYFPATVRYTCFLIIPPVLASACMAADLMAAFSLGKFRIPIMFWSAVSLFLFAGATFFRGISDSDYIVTSAVTLGLGAGAFLVFPKVLQQFSQQEPLSNETFWSLRSGNGPKTLLVEAVLLKPLAGVSLAHARQLLAEQRSRLPGSFSGFGIYPNRILLGFGTERDSSKEGRSILNLVTRLLTEIGLIVTEIRIASQTNTGTENPGELVSYDQSGFPATTALYSPGHGLAWGQVSMSQGSARLLKHSIDIYLNEGVAGRSHHSSKEQAMDGVPLIRRGLVRGVIFTRRPVTGPDWVSFKSKIDRLNQSTWA